MMSRKRNPNFSEMEVEILLGEVEKHKGVLFSKISNVVTNSAKKRVWESICEKVYASNTSCHQRTVDELKKKWTTYASNTKKQASYNHREALKTGGGPPPLELTPLQDKVIGIIGDTPIVGITGGTDTCCIETTASTSNENSSNISFCASGEACNDSDSDVVSHARSKKRTDDIDSEILIDIERERLEIEKQILSVGKKRLEVEKQRLEIERQRLFMDQQKHQLYLAQLRVHMSQFGEQVEENTQNNNE